MLRKALRLRGLESQDVQKVIVRNSAPGIKTGARGRLGSVSGFTIVEVVISVFISTLVFATVIYAYVGANNRAEWSAYSFAAQSIATQGVEQARAAQWNPLNWPVLDDLPVTNYTQIEKLDIPASGPAVFATNYVSISTVTNSPEIRQIRADCVWMLVSRYHGAAGPFTNTAVTFRASDQ
jgi:type II secretory pathway pseudopilin PulG